MGCFVPLSLQLREYVHVFPSGRGLYRRSGKRALVALVSTVGTSTVGCTSYTIRKHHDGIGTPSPPTLAMPLLLLVHCGAFEFLALRIGAALAVSRHDNATVSGDLAAVLNFELQRMVVDFGVRPHV